MLGMSERGDRTIIPFDGLNHAVFEKDDGKERYTWLTCCGLAFVKDFTKKGMVTCLMCLSNLSLSVDTMD